MLYLLTLTGLSRIGYYMHLYVVNVCIIYLLYIPYYTYTRIYFYIGTGV